MYKLENPQRSVKHAFFKNQAFFKLSELRTTRIPLFRIAGSSRFCILTGFPNSLSASVAQLAEQLICNQPVVGSNPSAGLVGSAGSFLSRSVRLEPTRPFEKRRVGRGDPETVSTTDSYSIQRSPTTTIHKERRKAKRHKKNIFWGFARVVKGGGL